MLRAEGIAFGKRPSQPGRANVREAKIIAVPLEPILRDASFDQLGRDGGCRSRRSGALVLGEAEAARAVGLQHGPECV